LQSSLVALSVSDVALDVSLVDSVVDVDAVVADIDVLGLEAMRRRE
jgi:hypothetical protein